MLNKIESLKRIKRLGLNIHNTVFTNDLEVIKRVVQEYNYMCSIRTDKEQGVTKDLPFYLISSKDDYERVHDKLALNKKEGMVFIVSNGHQYDTSLRYNMVVSFERDGSFDIEYSPINVPLRHMYRYPEEMVYIEGNINETVASWKVNNKEHNKINIRDVGKEVASIYMEIYNKNLWDRNLEVSVYDKKCGELGMEHVYWEV